MATKITVPRLGWSMDEGVFVGWLKQDGDAVKEGEFLFELEGDKAGEEIESFDQGILRLPPDSPKPGDPVRVGQCLGFLCQPGETPPNSCSEGPASSAASVPSEITGSESESSPPPNRSAQVPDATPTVEATPRIPVSPRAAAKALELGIALDQIQGTGRGGRIRERDVLKAAQGSTSHTTVPLSPTRKLIAARMVEGSRQTAPVTLVTKADATKLLHLRKRWKAAAEAKPYPVPSLTALFVQLVVSALESHKEIQQQWTPNGLQPYDDIHIAVAVDTGAALLTPVIRNAQALSLQTISKKLQDLIERSRGGHIKPDELQGGTFTVTNLGQYAVDAFTPILNPPQSAILGIGRIQPEPTAQSGSLIIRDRVSLSLTFDHRVHDGVTAARFLTTLADRFNEPPRFDLADETT